MKAAHPAQATSSTQGYFFAVGTFEKKDYALDFKIPTQLTLWAIMEICRFKLHVYAEFM